MKTLLTFSLCLFAIVAHAANPSTKSFRATGGLVVTSNDVTGVITYDGSLIVGSTNAPASSTSAGRGMSNLVWSRVLHVDSLFGTNATAIRGDASKPYRDVHWAHSNAVAGDTVLIRPGFYDLGTNHIRGTPGVSIVGSGLNGVILTGTGQLLTEGPLIGAASTQLVKNVTLITLASGNTFHAGWGSVSGINAAFTNARLENVEMITDTDGIYVNHTAPCSGRVFDCRIDSRWDCWVQAANSNHFFEVWNTSATANNFQPAGGAITNEANVGQAATCLRNLSGTIEWHGGTLIATNGEFDGTFAVIPDNSGVHTNFTRLYGVRLVAAGTNAAARIFVVNPATHGFVYEHAGEPIFTQPTAGAYQALYNDGVISVTNAVSRTITLPDIAPLARDVWTGLRLTVHDRSQLAATTNIFISASGNQRINGNIVTTNISTAGGFMEFLVVGTNWYVVNLGSIGGGSGTPAGANFEVQFNNAGVFGASENFRFLSSGYQLQVKNPVTSTEVDIDGAGFISQATGGQGLAFGLGARTNLLISPSSMVSVRPAPGIGTNLFQVEGTNQVPVVSVTSNGNLIATGNATIGSGNGTLGYSTNHFVEGVPTLEPSVLRTPTNANSGVMVALPVDGITNQQVAVPLGVGQILTWNGTAFVASNQVAGGSAGVMTQTNFVLNQVYTNTTTTLISVRTFLTEAAVNGVASVEVMWSPAGGAGWTNLAASAMSTLLTGLAAQATNSMSFVLTNLGSFYFTNTSSGAGNSAGLVAGTGQITALGGATGPAGAAGEVTTSTLLITSNYIVGASNQLPIVYQTNLAQGMPYDAFPVLAMDGTDVVMTYSRGNAHTVTNSSLWMTRTKNAGASWETPFLVVTNNGWDVVNFSFGVASSGRYHIIHQMRSTTNGYSDAPRALFSDDKGTNWSVGGTISPIAGTVTNFQGTMGRIVVAANNRLLSPYYWISNDIANGQNYVLTSDDDGVSWVTNYVTGSFTTGFTEGSLACIGGSNIINMIRLDGGSAGSTTNRFLQMISANNGATWTASPAQTLSGGSSAGTGRNPMGMHVYTDPVDGVRIVAISGSRENNVLVRRDISAKRAWDSGIAWNNVSQDAPERGAIGAAAGVGGYASPIWLPGKAEVICAYYYEISPTSSQIRFLQLPRR